VATRFRQWATERLREYIVKGFTLDDERLKGRDRQADYFDELLSRGLAVIRYGIGKGAETKTKRKQIVRHPCPPPTHSPTSAPA
jgi:hypothetical protein